MHKLNLVEIKTNKCNRRWFDIERKKTKIGRVEVGTITSQTDTLWVDKLLIEKGSRCHGLGSQTVSLVEAIAREMGRNKLKVKVKPLDKKITQETLEDFYSKNGFVESSDFPNELVMEKVLY